MLIAKIIQKEKRSEKTVGLVFTETEVLRLWGGETQKSGISQVDKALSTTTERL